MSKKFVVRLRKGGVTGTIVANSQVITIEPLSAGGIFPSNFDDGRLAGRVVTTNRAANFIKSIIPKPTTTTTSTTTLPPQGTTTTTTLGPGQTTTTTTFRGSSTTTTSSNKYSDIVKIESITPAEMFPGNKVTVKIVHPKFTTNQSFRLGIFCVQDAGIKDYTLAPDLDTFVKPSFYKPPLVDQIILTDFVITESSQGSVTIVLEINKNISWLTKPEGLTKWTWSIYKSGTWNSAGSINPMIISDFRPLDPVLKPVLKPNTNLPEINIVRNNDTSLDQTFILPGETAHIKLSNLVVGRQYAVVLKHVYEFGSSIVNNTRKFSKTWFNETYRVNAGKDAWMIGGISNDYPAKIEINASDLQAVAVAAPPSVTAYWYTFEAVSTTKTITLGIANNLFVNFINTEETADFTITSSNFRDASQYLFTVDLDDMSTATVVNAFEPNRKIQNRIVLRDTKIQILSTITDNNYKLTRDKQIRIALGGSRDITANDSGPSGLQIVVCVLESTSGQLSSNSFNFGIGFVGDPLPHNSSYPGNQNLTIDIGSRTKISGSFTVSLKPGGTYKNGKFSIDIYMIKKNVETPDSTTLVSRYVDLFTIDDSLLVPSSNDVLFNNFVYTPANAILNETPSNNTLKFSVDVVATSVQKLYWKMTGTGIQADDFIAGFSGSFDTKNGTTSIKDFSVIVKADAAIEGDEKFQIAFFTSSTATTPFYTIPTIFTIKDTSTKIDEIVKLSDTNKTYSPSIPVKFQITNGIRNDSYNIIVNGAIRETKILDENGEAIIDIDFTGVPDVKLPVTFSFKGSGNERVVEVPFGALSAISNPFDGNLEFGRLYLGTGQEGEDLYGQAYKFTKSTAGITKIIISVKLSTNTASNVTYDDITSPGEYVAYDSTTPETENSGTFAIPSVGQLRAFTGTHPEESNFGYPAVLIFFRMTITYNNGLTWSTSPTSKPKDYVRTGGTGSGGDG